MFSFNDFIEDNEKEILAAEEGSGNPQASISSFVEESLEGAGDISILIFFLNFTFYYFFPVGKGSGSFQSEESGSGSGDQQA